MTVAGTLLTKLGITHTKALDLSTPRDAIEVQQTTPITNGTSAGQADLIWHDEISIATSSNNDTDLSGSLTDAYGDAVVFAKVKALLVRNTSADAEIKIDQSVTNGWLAAITDEVIIPAGGLAYFECAGAGWAVTAGTGDILRLTNNDGSNAATVEMAILGTSA